MIALNTRTHLAKTADSAGVEGTQDFFLVIECNEIVSLHCDSCDMKIVTRVRLTNSRNQCMHRFKNPGSKKTSIDYSQSVF